ncbi:MAG: signal peptide peptidase SppA [Candidatus Aminicenantales bacterium]
MTMKKRTYVLIIFLIFLFLGTAALLSYFALELGQPRATVPPHAYLELDLSGEIQEISQPNLFRSLILGIKPQSVYDLWMNIRKAKADARVEAILIRLNLLSCDWAKVTEIRDAILDFRKSGKKAYAYIDEAPDFDKEYYLATACDKIILHPMGWLGVNGIGGYVPFFRNALDKLGIQAQFEHVEEYKTAYNQFTEPGFTPAHREMMESIYGDLFDQYVKTVAAARKKTPEEYRALIDGAFYQGQNALDAGLVDELLYEDQLQDRIQNGGRKLRKITSEAYSRISPTSVGIDGGRRIALIYAVGPILSGESLPESIGGATVSRWIRQAREDSSIAAIVFRVDSPGGSSTASDVIWREVFLARKEKPFIVSMSDVAGSGGYWISMPAHKIVAQPQTLTGSIGVLAGKVDLSGLYGKLGITAEKLAYGKESDIFSSFRPFSPEEKKILKDQIRWTYDRFLDKAAEGRNMSREEIDKIGRGRVWTGNQARELGLVDEIGGVTKAVELAKHMAGIARENEVKLVVWPRKRGFWESIFSRKSLEVLSDIGPGSKLRQTALALRLLEKPGIWAVMPFWPTP